MHDRRYFPYCYRRQGTAAGGGNLYRPEDPTQSYPEGRGVYGSDSLGRFQAQGRDFENAAPKAQGYTPLDSLYNHLVN